MLVRVHLGQVPLVTTDVDSSYMWYIGDGRSSLLITLGVPMRPPP